MPWPPRPPWPWSPRWRWWLSPPRRFVSSRRRFRRVARLGRSARRLRLRDSPKLRIGTLGHGRRCCCGGAGRQGCRTGPRRDAAGGCAAGRAEHRRSDQIRGAAGGQRHPCRRRSGGHLRRGSARNRDSSGDPDAGLSERPGVCGSRPRGGQCERHGYRVTRTLRRLIRRGLIRRGPIRAWRPGATLPCRRRRPVPGRGGPGRRALSGAGYRAPRRRRDRAVRAVARRATCEQ